MLTIVDTDVHTWNDSNAEQEAAGGGSSEGSGEACRPKPPLDVSEEVSIRLAMVGVSVIDSTPQVSSQMHKSGSDIWHVWRVQPALRHVYG